MRAICDCRLAAATVRDIYQVGVPSIIMQAIGTVMNLAMNALLIAYSTTAVAVFGVYFKIQSVVFMPVFGMTNAAMSIMAYNYGARSRSRLLRTMRLMLFAALALMAIGLVCFQLFPAELLLLFEASEDMLGIGVPALRIIGVTFVLAGFCIPAGSVCQAIGNPAYSLITSACRQLVVLLPAAWLLAQTGRLELVWLAFPIAELMSLLLSSIFLGKTMKKAQAVMLSKMNKAS